MDPGGQMNQRRISSPVQNYSSGYAPGGRGWVKDKPTMRSSFSVFQCFAGIMCLFLFHRILQKPEFQKQASELAEVAYATLPDMSTATGSHSSRYNPLGIPEGEAPNLPSVRVSNADLDTDRTIYGGKGDKVHLGGFTELDMQGITPAVWKHVVQNWTVQSVIDVGCGRGTSTSWFYTHGLRTRCVEGSHDALQKSMVPDKSILTEHDFSRGPWWPGETYDMVWAVEFLEHVGLNFQYNYVTTFRKAAILLVTSSNWGGWHHVEVHPEDWWIRKYEMYGFVYDEKLTKEIKHVASLEQISKTIFPVNGKELNAQHVYSTMKVFINPVVAALPEHAHLFFTPGCYKANNFVNRECGKTDDPNKKKLAEQETPMDPSYFPLKLTEAQDQAWYDILKANVKVEGL